MSKGLIDIVLWRSLKMPGRSGRGTACSRWPDKAVARARLFEYAHEELPEEERNEIEEHIEGCSSCLSRLAAICGELEALGTDPAVSIEDARERLRSLDRAGREESMGWSAPRAPFLTRLTALARGIGSFRWAPAVSVAMVAFVAITASWLLHQDRGAQRPWMGWMAAPLEIDLPDRLMDTCEPGEIFLIPALEAERGGLRLKALGRGNAEPVHVFLAGLRIQSIGAAIPYIGVRGIEEIVVYNLARLESIFDGMADRSDLAGDAGRMRDGLKGGNLSPDELAARIQGLCQSLGRPAGGGWSDAEAGRMLALGARVGRAHIYSSLVRLGIPHAWDRLVQTVEGIEPPELRTIIEENLDSHHPHARMIVGRYTEMRDRLVHGRLDEGDADEVGQRIEDLALLILDGWNPT